LNFKDHGNEYFQGKRYREAANYYLQGIDAKPTDQSLLESLLLNRAACNLKLENYGSVLRDCSKALTINQKSSKAYFRSASALKALERYDEAVDCCDRCLVHDQENKTIRDLHLQLLGLQTAQAERRKRKELEEQKERLEKQLLKVALRKRNIITVGTDDVQDGPHKPTFDLTNDPSGSSMTFPVFFFYPQHATSDTISDFIESSRFYDHLSVMFPPQGEVPGWDSVGEYRTDNLVIYAMTRGKRLLKVGKKMTLMDVFNASAGKDGAMDGLELKQGYLSFAVLPRGDQEIKWVNEYKSSR